MAFTEQIFFVSADLFLEKIFADFNDKNIRIHPYWQIDHLCYRVDSLEKYVELKKSFEQFSKLLIESQVNGRPIATFKLNNPINFQHWCIDLVELPAPKKGKVVLDGFEHLEVVSNLSFKNLRFQYSHLNLDLSGLEKELNPELEISLGERNMKFHTLSLASLITLEKNHRVLNALTKSKIMKEFKPFQPLLAGAFPLGINTSTSSLDILLTHQDLKELESLVTVLYGSAAHFKTHISNEEGLETLIAKFDFEAVAFKIFAQTKETTEQTAYLHFQIEERLLKIGGEPLQQKVFELKNEGYETEPAFAKILGLSGDPCHELLLLHKHSDAELLNRFKY